MPRPLPVPALAALGAVWLGSRIQRTRTHARRHPAYWADWADRDLGDDPFVWVALGDSTSQSVGVDDPGEGWIATNARRLEAELGRPVRVVNLAVSGCRIPVVVEQQLPRLRELLAEGRVDLVTCCIGANDVVKTGYDPDRYRRCLEEVAATMPEGSVLADLPCFGPAWSPLAHFERRAELLDGYVHDAAARYGHVLARLHEQTATEWPLRVWGNVASDFFHPNQRGYEVWTRVMGAAIDEALARRAA